MKTIFFLLALSASVHSFDDVNTKVGAKDVLLKFHANKAEAFTRRLSDGRFQQWNLIGSNKGTWVDEKGKKVPSSNYVYVPPNSLKIKKVTKADEGSYDHVEAPIPLPPGVDHIDPGFTEFFVKVD
ncbi:hypothetical protein CAEBREN_08165 [Caenorhabditis brenneri]|uniref:Uncharacterized protein n=1 Tax=Caenorhabditis brenneri TaxID=135651 RepID=G0PKD2_CAEBE|nr:hypothetical protein CAEBREN_08165 [Caenorhabditis brenneri]